MVVFWGKRGHLLGQGLSAKIILDSSNSVRNFSGKIKKMKIIVDKLNSWDYIVTLWLK